MALDVVARVVLLNLKYISKRSEGNKKGEMNENESCIHESEFVWTLGGHPIHDSSYVVL
jgi:hypothetical protein